MTTSRRQHSGEFKAKVVLEALRRIEDRLRSLSPRTLLFLRYIVTTNLFPRAGIVLGIGSLYAEALFPPDKESRRCSSYDTSSIG